jgi:hypothetical protein
VRLTNLEFTKRLPFSAVASIPRSLRGANDSDLPAQSLLWIVQVTDPTIFVSPGFRRRGSRARQSATCMRPLSCPGQGSRARGWIV